MRIQHNIMAMSAYRNYTNNVSAMKKNLEKLSSGYKINRAGDDAAGLAISEKMRAQITGLETAQKNAKDGISLVQTAEGALTEVHDMLNRMVELASMSANGTYDNTTDRKQLQKEMDQLTAEINRIADSSNFNGINLLDGSMQTGGGGSTINGIDRIIDKVLAAGEDPIDLTGERTILDSGSGSSQATKFDVDLTGLTGAGTRIPDPETPETPDAPDGAQTATATTEANNNANPATKTQASITLTTAGGVTIGTATNAQSLGNLTLDGTKISDLFDLSHTPNGGTAQTDWTDTTRTFGDQDVVALQAKNAGALTDAQIAALKTLFGDANVTPGVNEGGASAATPDTNVLTFDLAKLGGGQSFTINGKKFEIISDGSDASDGATKIDTNGKTEAQVAKAISDALKADLTDFDVTTYDAAHYDGAAHTLTVTMKGNLEQPIEVSTKDEEAGTAGGEIINVATTPGTPANPGATGAYATATYGTVKAGNIAVGTEITIGGKKVTIVKDDDADLTDGMKADGSKVGIGSLDKLGDAFAALNYADGAVELTDDGLKITAMSKATTANALTTGAAVTIAKAQGITPETPDPVDPETFKFDFKLGGTVLAKEIEVRTDATSDEIADAIFGALTDADTDADGMQVKIGDINYTVTKDTAGKLSFELKDDPTADNIKGNYDWDAIADEGNFKGNHTAGTTVTQQGQVGASNAIANTVFRIEKGDIKDGAKITLNDKTVTLAVGENSTVAAKDKSGNDVDNIIDLRKLDPDNITDADLSDALGKIAKAFQTDTVFTVGVNDESNGDTHTGLTVHKKVTGDDAPVFDTKEKLAAVFSMTTPGTGKALTLQIGDTADSYNQLKVDIQDMHADSLGLNGVKISDQDSAAAAIDKIKAAINTVSDVRGTLGATQNRLDHTINNLSVMTENIQDAESTIRDVDVANEMMAYTKNNILIQSAQAMLAQANQVPQGVLQLLQ